MQNASLIPPSQIGYSWPRQDWLKAFAQVAPHSPSGLVVGLALSSKQVTYQSSACSYCPVNVPFFCATGPIAAGKCRSAKKERQGFSDRNSMLVHHLGRKRRETAVAE
jgi:hypothetical protein